MGVFSPLMELHQEGFAIYGATPSSLVLFVVVFSSPKRVMAFRCIALAQRVVHAFFNEK